jgi:molybdate transport system substrate-binding protein
MRRPLLAAATALLATFGSTIATASELKVLGPTAMRAAIADIAAQFSKSSEDKLTIGYATVGVIADRIVKGEAVDAAIVSKSRMDELAKQGKIATGSRSEIARVGIGVFVRAGAAKPDLGSVDAFKRTLLALRSLSYGDPANGGVTGVYFVGLLERLGIAAELKPKTQMFPTSQAVLQAVAKGEVEVGIGLTSDSAMVSGVELAGVLPAEIQNFTTYSAAVVAGSAQANAAKSFVGFFSSPAAKAVLTAKGFEPL